MPRRWLARAALVGLTLSGCARPLAEPVALPRPPEARPTPGPPQAPASRAVPEVRSSPAARAGALSRGDFRVQAGRRGLVVAAPHGSTDLRTGEMAADIARRTGFGLVVAEGFIEVVDGRTARRAQVNRPLEGVPGRPPAEEVATAEARRVYEAFASRVGEAAQGPLLFYVELHGNGHRDAADRIEIATVGIDRDEALRLRTLLELSRDAHLRASAGAPRLAVAVEPVDPLRYGATGAKRDGILRLPARALHIELPQAARGEWRGVYAALLADFLAGAASLATAR